MEEINKEPFKELIKKYRSITSEQIEKISKCEFCMGDVAAELTGWGCTLTCILCLTFKEECSKCYGIECGVNRKKYACVGGVHEKTYANIGEAQTFNELFNAFNERANHIEEWLEGFDDEFEDEKTKE